MSNSSVRPGNLESIRKSIEIQRVRSGESVDNSTTVSSIVAVRFRGILKVDRAASSISSNSNLCWEIDLINDISGFPSYSRSIVMSVNKEGFSSHPICEKIPSVSNLTGELIPLVGSHYIAILRNQGSIGTTRATDLTNSDTHSCTKGLPCSECRTRKTHEETNAKKYPYRLFLKNIWIHISKL